MKMENMVVYLINLDANKATAVGSTTHARLLVWANILKVIVKRKFCTRWNIHQRK